MKRFICIFTLVLMIMAGEVLAETTLSIEVFNQNGERIILSQNEIDFIASALPSVRQIIAYFKKGSIAGTNLYISFRLKDGSWKDTNAGVGNVPTSWHIRNLIQDELKFRTN